MLGGECQTSFTCDSAACCMPWHAAGQARDEAHDGGSTYSAVDDERRPMVMMRVEIGRGAFSKKFLQKIEKTKKKKKAKTVKNYCLVESQYMS